VREEHGRKSSESRSSRQKGPLYDATKITVLEGIEAVRMRPAMYVGDVSVRGLHHCVYEVVDNSIDEALAGYCNRVQVALNADGSVTINDDGRGIPVDMHATEKKPAVEVVLTTLHAGGKFDDQSYKVARGLHGVGVSCVNALSEWLEVEIRRDGKIHRQRFERGRVASHLEVIGETKTTGTKITFRPDGSVFSTTEFEWDILANRLRELAFLNRGVEIKLTQEKPEREEIFNYRGGIREFVEHLCRSKSPLHPKVIYFETERDDIAAEIAMQYTDTYNESISCFANNINTIEGGTHLSGFRSALTRTINAYAKANKLIKDDKETMSGDDIREGLTAIISVKVPKPQFEGQTKTKLGNSEVQGIVESIVNGELSAFLEEHPSVARRIINKAAVATRARAAARKAREVSRRGISPESPSEADLERNREEADALEQRLRVNLQQRSYLKAFELLAKCCDLDEARRGRLEQEFGFLKCVQRHHSHPDPTLECRSFAWSHLSTRNKLLTSVQTEPRDSPVQDSNEPAPAPIPQPVNVGLASEMKGERLEQATLRLLKQFFKISEDDESILLSTLRKQFRGSQFGYDIGFDCVLQHDTGIRCRIECKNHSGAVTPKDVTDKLALLEATGARIDHWVLISPHADPSNTLNMLLEHWEKERTYSFSVQCWSPASNIAEFFGLVPEVYDDFFLDALDGDHPRDWTPDKRRQVAARWRDKLRRPMRLETVWTRYLRTPRLLCFDREPPEEFERLYDHHVQLHCTTSDGAATKQNLQEVMDAWLEEPHAPVIFLLGGFGDGKTVFTYTYSRRKMTAYHQSQEKGYVPIRIALRSYQEAGDARALLRRRLEEIGATVQQFIELKRTTQVLVILDGFDEMSKRLDEQSVLENIKALLRCCEECDGAKILITSRTHFFENRRDKEKLLDRLDNPTLVYLESIPRATTTRHLLEFAQEAASQEVVARLHCINDPIGLASKPLFLEMVKATILDLPEALDQASLYATYTEASLRRKIEHLEDDALNSTRDDIVRRMLNILESVAVALQQSSAEFVSLLDLAEARDLRFAKLLWDSAGSDFDEDDAAARIGIRSLLARVDAVDASKKWCVDFCHRSMKEYFVGRRLHKELARSRNHAEIFLSETPMSHEILDFAVGHMKRDASVDWGETLLEIIKTSAVAGARRGHAGGYAATLLYRLSGELPGAGWSGLNLDYADLSGADLSRRDFSCTSLRNSCLDNVNLEGADFRRADLTGVRLEETASVCALAVARDGVIAAYGDNTVRHWKIWGTERPDCQTVFEKDSAPIERLGVFPNGNVWALSGSDLLYLDWNEAGGLKLSTRFGVHPSCTAPILTSSGLVYLDDSKPRERRIVSVETTGRHSSFQLKDCEPLLFAPVGNRHVAHYSRSDGLILQSYTGASMQIAGGSTGDVTCLASLITDDQRLKALLAFGNDSGSVSVWQVDLNEEGFGSAPLYSSMQHDGAVTTIQFVDEYRVASGGQDRSIIVSRSSQGDDGVHASIERRLHFTIRCRGMMIDGLKGEHEHSRLSQLIIKAR